MALRAATVGAFGLTLAMLPIAKTVAQTAGRVVMAVGDVTVQRTNDRVKLAQGGEVRVGEPNLQSDELSESLAEIDRHSAAGHQGADLPTYRQRR